MKIAIVGTVGVPACYGGFETLVENLLSMHSCEVTVYCTSRAYETKLKCYRGAKLVYLPLNANGPQSIVYDALSILHSVLKGNDAILVLGVSGAMALPLVKMLSGARIITNIDGLEWKRDKWSSWTQKFLRLCESVAVRHSDAVVSDNAGIAEYVKTEYGVKSEVIAYGGDHAVSSDVHISDEGYALALCRIEPENNALMILEAFAQSGEHLKFVGNWGASEYGRGLVSQYGGFENIDLLDPLYRIDALQKIRSACSYYVHGHSAGGTNPSLVEIMHFGKPVLAYDCIYNRATTEDCAYYFKSTGDLVKMVTNLTGNFRATGAEMLNIAKRRYTWGSVRVQYENLLLKRG